MTRLCEICGSRSARYICQECGRAACEFCFIPERWLCMECYKKLAYPTPTPTEIRVNFPFKLFLIGFILTFIGTLILMLSSLSASSPQGGIIWIFPLPPFIFGTTQGENWLFLISIAFFIIFLAILIVIIYKSTKARIDI